MICKCTCRSSGGGVRREKPIPLVACPHPVKRALHVEGRRALRGSTTSRRGARTTRRERREGAGLARFSARTCLMSQRKSLASALKEPSGNNRLPFRTGIVWRRHSHRSFQQRGANAAVSKQRTGSILEHLAHGDGALVPAGRRRGESKRVAWIFHVPFVSLDLNLPDRGEPVAGP